MAALVFGLLSTAIILAGCTPPEKEDWAGLRVEGDEVRIIVSLCEGEHTTALSLFTEEKGENAWWDAFAPMDVREAAPEEFTLFEAPEGWEIEVQGDLAPLSDDMRYGFLARTTGYPVEAAETRARTSSLNFTLQQLRNLDEDEVLVTTESTEGRVMSIDTFEMRAQEAC